MSMPVIVQNTRYYSGVSLPFFISHGMVESRAADLEFSSIEWHERNAGPPPVDPHGDPAYSDDWDEWATIHADEASLDPARDLYVDTGALKYRGTAGTVTTIAAP